MSPRLKGMAQVSVQNPKVSVIVPACDVDRYVRRAVESVQNQTLGDFEILVVDAASSDRTADIVTAMAERDIRIELLRAETSNLADACNLGLEHARGTYAYMMIDTNTQPDEEAIEKLKQNDGILRVRVL